MNSPVLVLGFPVVARMFGNLSQELLFKLFSSGKCVFLRSEFKSTAEPQYRGVSGYLTKIMIRPLIYIVEFLRNPGESGSTLWSSWPFEFIEFILYVKITQII